MGPRPTIDMQCFLKSNSISPPIAEQYQDAHMNGSASWHNNSIENSEVVASEYNVFPYQVPVTDDSHLFIVATDIDFQVILNLPGFLTSDVSVKIRNGNTLFLKGRQRRNNEERSTKGGFADKGFRYTIALPEDVLANDASACMENGRLIISCAKAEIKQEEQTKSQKIMPRREQALPRPKIKETNKISIDVREFRKDGQVIVKFIGKRHLVVEGEAESKCKQADKIARHFYLPKDMDLRTLESVRIKSSDGFMVLHIPTGKPKLDVLEVTIPISNHKSCRSKICGRIKNLKLKRNDNKRGDTEQRVHRFRGTNRSAMSSGEDSEAESVVTIIPSQHQEEGILYRATVVSQPWTGCWRNENYTNHQARNNGDTSIYGSGVLPGKNQYNMPYLYSYESNSFSEITLLSKFKENIYGDFPDNHVQSKGDASYLQNEENYQELSTLADIDSSLVSESKVQPVIAQLTSMDNSIVSSKINNNNKDLLLPHYGDSEFESSIISNSSKDIQLYQHGEKETDSSRTRNSKIDLGPYQHSYNETSSTRTSNSNTDLQPYQYGDNDVVSSTETFTTQCHNGSIAAAPQSLHSELQRPNKRQRMETAKKVTFSNGIVACVPNIINLQDNKTVTATSISRTPRINDETRLAMHNNHRRTFPQENCKFTTQSTIFLTAGNDSEETSQTSSNILSIVMNSVNTKQN